MRKSGHKGSIGGSALALRRRLPTIAGFCLGMAMAALLGAQVAAEAEGCGLFVLFNGFKIQADKAVILAAPDSEQILGFVASAGSTDVMVSGCKGGGWCQARGRSLVWTAPSEPGKYSLKVDLEVHDTKMDDSVLGPPDDKTDLKSFTITCLVGYPSSMLKDGKLNGFELGEYPDWRNTNNPELYMPPDYFYYSDHKVIKLYLSEHLRIADIAYDGRAGFPQYFALDYELVRKLEVLYDELELMGLPNRYHFVGGGFISPRSNKIRTRRNSAAADLSRHMWGEAVDFIIDESPKDEIMDDMNEDGIIDVRDALFVRDLLAELEESGRCKPGGVGVYSPPKNSQIQLHVDVRGFPTRWGVKEYDPEIFSGVPPKRSMRPGG